MSFPSPRVAYALSLLALAAGGLALVAGIFSAGREAIGPNRLVVPLRVERAAIAQVFYDRGAGIREEDSAATGLGPTAALRDVEFPLPRARVRALRFDPIAFAGKFAVGAPRLVSASGRVIARLPLAAITPANQIAELRREGNQLEGVTTPGANDPQLQFALEAPLPAGTPTLPWWRAVFFVAAGVVAWRLRTQPGNAGWLSRSAADFLARSTAARAWLAGASPMAVAFGAVLVGGVEWWLLWPLHRTLDWPLWDESNYAAFGAAWARGGGALGELHSAPLYMAAYGVWSHLGGLATAIFAQHYFVKLGSTVLLYLVLARWWRSWSAAAGVALAWGATQFQLEFPLLVYQAAWLWFLAALVVVDRWPLAGLSLAVLATGVRQEYQFAAVALALWLAWQGWRRRGAWRTWLATDASRRSLACGVVLAVAGWGIVGAVATQTSFAHSAGRAWFAFQQHYAARAVATGEVKGINPALDYSQVVRKDFPGAGSLMEAWKVNSGAVVRHVGYNFRHAPGELAALGEAHAGLRGAAWVLLVGALVVLAAGGGRRTEDGKIRGWLASAILAAGALVVVTPGLVVLAKGAYLLPLVPAAIGAIGWRVRRAGRNSAWAAGCGVVLVVAGVVALVVAPRVFVAGERGRPVAETVAELEKLWPKTGREALIGASASSYAHYLGDARCLGVEPLAEAMGVTGQNETLAALLTKFSPRAVLVTDEWRQSARFDAQEIARELAPPEWTRREVPAGQLYWRAR